MAAKQSTIFSDLRTDSDGSYSFRSEKVRIVPADSNDTARGVDFKHERFDHVVIGDKLIPKSEMKGFAQHLYDKNIKVLESIEEHLRLLYLNFSFLPEWEKDGIEKPNIVCEEKTFAYAGYIFRTFNILPMRIAPSVEEGIMITYWSPEKQRELKIEIYNDLDVAAVLSENKEIIRCKDIGNTFSGIDEFLKEFIND